MISRNISSSSRLKVTETTSPVGAALAAFYALCSGVLLLALLGCDGGNDSVHVSVPAGVGQVELGLLARGSEGTLFRLRSAILMVQGPDQTLFFDTEDDPDQTTLGAVVSAGAYESFLQEGWRLERVDDPTAPIEASLLSPNPDHFEILAGQSTRLALRFRVEGDVATTNPGALEVALEVEEEPMAPRTCANDSECGDGQVCCIAGLLGNCFSLEPGASCPLPDLIVSPEDAAVSLRVDWESFAADSCAIQEGCVAQAGLRRLLRFSTTTANIGDMDLVLGAPATDEHFEYAACHGHYHFEGYAHYELVDAAGAVVAEGHKQAFCLLDSAPIGLPGAASRPRYHCEFQGIQRGWADTYGSNLDCQWVDVTDVADGEYRLRISVNTERLLPESDYDNNAVEIPVTVAEPPPIDPLAECTPPAASSPVRDCGWALADGFIGAACTPGERVRVGCGCPDASCEGDPMLRVCEGSQACPRSEARALAQDTCGTCPQVSFVCPESGSITVLTASSDLQPYRCDVIATPVPPL